MSSIWIQRGAAAACVLAALAAPALVQEPSDAPSKAEFEAAFRRMLERPDDLDLMFRHAEMAVAVRDYEAAAGTLERMLLLNPNLPRVHLELGVAYFSMGLGMWGTAP